MDTGVVDTGVVPRDPSQTALLTAAARALHRQEPPPWILDDTLALPLAGPDGMALAERVRAELSPEEMSAFCRWVCVRARVAEDEVERGLGSGVHQYVVLGAGLDSFAYRRLDLMDRLRVFEVDHPASQAWKRRRLQELGIAEPDSLVFAPVDFERQTLDDGLNAAGFRFAEPVVVSWMGVTMYLTHEAISATLDSVARCARGSRLVMTYNQPPALMTALDRRVSTSIQSAVAIPAGEPFISLFTPEDIEQLVADSGLTRVEHFGPDEARRTYLDGRADVPIAGVQRVLVASVA
jgi:methyltransferase (TIGR00027 family)